MTDLVDVILGQSELEKSCWCHGEEIQHHEVVCNYNTLTEDSQQRH